MKSNNYKNSVKGLRKLTLGKTNKEVIVKNKKNSFKLDRKSTRLNSSH